MSATSISVGVPILAMMALVVELAIAQDGGVPIQDQNGCNGWNAKPQPGDTIRWSGSCKEGWLEGSGTLEWFENGQLSSVMQTTMLRGRATGFTKLSHLRAKFAVEGEFVNGKPHGYGESRNVEAGEHYVGEFWEGQRHGMGTVVLADGERQEGQFKFGQLNGFAVITSPNGVRMKGIASNGALNGPGSQFFVDGVRVDTVFEEFAFKVGTACRETGADYSFVGTIKVKRDGMKVCNKSSGAKIADLFALATEAFNTYAVANGYQPVTNPSDPFSFVSQIAQVQAMRMQMRQIQPQPMTLAPQIVSSANQEIAALRAQLAARDQQLATEQQQRQSPSPELRNDAQLPSPQQSTRAVPMQPPRAPQPSKRASFIHSDGYESDGSGGLIYNAYVENDGEVPLTCDTRISGIVWSATGANNLQTNYSDRRTAVVYPGRRTVAVGFSRVVANSGRYEMSCQPK